ncbi:MULTISPECIES: NADAR family protein [Pseudomonas chlororaphis group]|uniref:NADAR family protein n=1 Tax=Pseudomonas chlororaphis group TaxID=136842 RepID=UPI00228243A3|nr:NADAR family protein [Pseudomonas protegens]MCY7260528.1 NADAR family protein [Pseudomonas protegens]
MDTPIRSNQALLEQIKHGLKPDYLMFWGHQPTRDGRPSPSCFSQWFAVGFEIEGIHYPSAEHFMMAGKALLFDDRETHGRILKAVTPADVKQLGREVRGFDDTQWQAARFDIVVQGNLAKFSQHSALGEYLLSTRDQVLVEASPVDRIWGIGLAAEDAKASRPEQWRGLNLLGYALMEVRDRLRTA